ncbi:MAG: hypothetical protein HQK66_14495, partial [Desulfamplus sp.]|nr:hypothetical protein [Desulfamplus sp.]
MIFCAAILKDSNFYLVERSYKEDSQISAERLLIDGSNFEITHEYDAAGRKVKSTYPGGQELITVWTERSQLLSQSFNGRLSASFSYDDGKRETERRFGNDLVQNSLYRTDNLLQSKSIAGVTGFSYDYDANKRKTEEINAEMPDYSQHFAYDPEARLVSWTRDGNRGSLRSIQMWNLSLEGDWNRTVTDGQVENRSHNGVHEITEVSTCRKTLAYRHDPRGNLELDPRAGQTYEWDFDNQLSAANKLDPKAVALLAEMKALREDIQANHRLTEKKRARLLEKLDEC